MAVGKIVYGDEFEFERWLKKQHARAAEMMEGWGLDPKHMLDLEIGWLLCLGRFEDKPMDLDLFQVGMMIQPARFRLMLKSRQIGFSFFIACESLARAHLKERHTAVCVSYNLDDAKQKVALVKELHDELPLRFQKKIVIDSKTVVGFESRSSKRRISKVISNPAKAPRGKTGDVYLDEIAHCLNDREIYKGSTALITRSKGQLTAGSTPMGQSGLFYDLWNDRSTYSRFWRQRVPWWMCKTFSKIARNEELIALASTLPTEVRVERYGTEELKDQFHSMPLEDFQQEYECAFQDERVAFYPYHLIDPCMQTEREKIPVYDSIKLLAAQAAGMGPLYLGYDVGRSKHPSELYIFEKQGETYVERYEVSLKDVPFPKQRRILFNVCDKLGQHWRKFRIDETGLGKNLAEDLKERYGRRIEPVTFTNAVKEDLANSLKILFLDQNIVLPRCLKLRGQIHSIKQRYTSAGNSIFDAERNRHHHADKMWAIALATHQPNRKKKKRPMEIRVRDTSKDAPNELPRDPRVEAALKNKRALDPAKTGIVAAMFTTPDEIEDAGRMLASGSPMPVDEDREIRLRVRVLTATTPSLEQESSDLVVAMRVYKRTGEEALYRESKNLYQRVRRELRRREAEGRKTSPT